MQSYIKFYDSVEKIVLYDLLALFPLFRGFLKRLHLTRGVGFLLLGGAPGLGAEHHCQLV